MIRDITERKRMLQTLQQAVMVKSEFTSMVSHELRTPLTAIKEAVDVVADGTAGDVNKHQADFLQLAKRNVDRLHRLINDTLDFSKLERGEFHLELADHELNALASEIVAQQRLAATKQRLRLEFAPDPELPPVRMDPDRISQLLINLISNAIRYCDSGWIGGQHEAPGLRGRCQDSGQWSGYSGREAREHIRSLHSAQYGSPDAALVGRAWAWPSARRSSSCMAAAFGSNPNSGRDRLSTLRCVCLKAARNRARRVRDKPRGHS